MSNPIFYGVHIPKTAGASFLKLFRGALNNVEFYQNTALIDIANEESLLLEELEDYSRLRLVFGHHISQYTMAMIQREPYVFTFLRDPVKRFMSAYVFDSSLRERQGRPKISFEQFVDCMPDNYICNWLISRFDRLIKSDSSSLASKAWDILNHFDLVSSAQFFDEDVPRLMERIGISNVVLGKENVSPKDMYVKLDTYENRDFLSQKLSEDIDLYNMFLEKRSKDGVWRREYTIDLDQICPSECARQLSLNETLFYCRVEFNNYGVTKREIKRAINRAAINICKAGSLLGINDFEIEGLIQDIRIKFLSD